MALVQSMNEAPDIGHLSRTELYIPEDHPNPTRFAIKCHPLADQICKELDDFFVKHWPFENDKARAKFVSGQHNRWACMAIPLGDDDRILDTVKVNTLLFLLDDVVENMSVEDGKAFYERLTPISMGKVLPNRDDPYEWITYDVWESMRACDEELANETLRQAFVCITAQVDEARMACKDMGQLLRHRAKEGGVAFVAAAMRYAMQLRLKPKDLESIPEIDESYAKLGTTVNDIHSFDKELRAWETNHQEGGHILNMVYMMANDTGLSYAAAKRVLWTLCREWEVKHQELVAARIAESKGCDDTLKTYLKGLEYVLGGNEAWSETTERYYERD